MPRNILPKTQPKAPDCKNQNKKKKTYLSDSIEIAYYSFPTDCDTCYKLVVIMCFQKGSFCHACLMLFHMNILDILSLMVNFRPWDVLARFHKEVYISPRYPG